jgi:hypothetical protein
MPIQRRSRRRIRRRRNRSKRFAFDPQCWGKNKPLEEFWKELSSHLSVVAVYKGIKPYEIITSVNADQLHALESDPRVVAILTSHPDMPDAYERLVYPLAKDKTVDYVITHYDKFFKRLPACMQKVFKNEDAPPLHKLWAPHVLKCE